MADVKAKQDALQWRIQNAHRIQEQVDRLALDPRHIDTEVARRTEANFQKLRDVLNGQMF